MGGGALIQFILLLRDRQRAEEREREGDNRGMETTDVREHFLLTVERQVL